MADSPLEGRPSVSTAAQVHGNSLPSVDPAVNGEVQVGDAAVAASIGLSLDGDGAPDFAAFEGSGGSVRGAIPPNGLTTFTVYLDGCRTTYYAAEVRAPGSRAATYVKGASVRSNGAATGAEIAQAAELAKRYVERLPDTFAQAQAQARSSPFDIKHLSETALDVKL